jgi:hypothetical protein
MSRRGHMHDTKGFVTGLPNFLLNLVNLWQPLRLTMYVSITFTSRSVYEFLQKQNPGPSGNDDLDASELRAAQVEDDEAEVEGSESYIDDVDITDDHVGFFFVVLEVYTK